MRPQFPDHGSNPHPLHWKPRVLTTGLPGTTRHTHFKDKKPVLEAFTPYTGVAPRAGSRVTDQGQLGQHSPQLWAREPQTGQASSGPDVSQPGRDLRGQGGLGLDDDSTPPRYLPFYSPGTDPGQPHPDFNLYTQVARNAQKRRLRTCFPALFSPLWNGPVLLLPACSCETPAMQRAGLGGGGLAWPLFHHASGLRQSLSPASPHSPSERHEVCGPR